MDLPELNECPRYPNVTMAEDACEGQFLMWGEFLKDWTGDVGSPFLVGGDGEEVTLLEQEKRAHYGPYWCSTCNNGTDDTSGTGYGYVGGDDDLPSRVSDCNNEDEAFSRGCNGGGVCEVYVPESLDDLTCAALQRHCETTGGGWLIYAKTFETAGGSMECSGGCVDTQGEVTFSGSYVDSLNGAGDTSLATWPMLAMWAMVLAVFGIATYVDFKRFTTGGKQQAQWFSKYLLGTLGYVDLEGEKNTFRSQVCFNPCCCCKNSTREHIDAWLEFLPIFVLSLGVAILFGDAATHVHVCFFDALPETEEYAMYETLLPEVFHSSDFGKGVWDNGDADSPSLHLFNLPWFAAELAIVLFAKSQDMLAFNLEKGWDLDKRATFLVMMMVSSVFTLLAILITDEVSFYELSILWTLGWILALVIAPCFGALSYALAKILVSCGCLPEPSSSSPGAGRTPAIAAPPVQSNNVAGPGVVTVIAAPPIGP